MKSLLWAGTHIRAIRPALSIHFLPILGVSVKLGKFELSPDEVVLVHEALSVFA